MPFKNPERKAAYDAAYHAAHREEEAAKKASYMAAWHAAHRAERAAYNAAYQATHKAEVGAYRAAHKAEKAARDATYRKQRAAYRKAHPEAHRLSAARNRDRYPERDAARNAVNLEVKTGRWPPANGQVCEICGEAQAREYHHHLGYAPEHWLHAQAVCKECHTEVHRKYSVTGDLHNGN